MDTNFKVLMTLMGLEIGGAETHVLELCKALNDKGVEVIIASNGGAYVKELEEVGIKHYQVPFHNKKSHNLLKSYNLIKKIIIENDIKLVHAHARIPAFICGLLQRKLKFRFVTTAHWIFKANFPFNVLTNWGEKSLAVSEDIKRYLIDNYNLTENDINVTINGIDINKFSADVSSNYLINEFQLNPNAYRIVYVSRMDKDRSFVAHKLIEIAENLFKVKDNLEILIVGGGNDYSNIKTKANEINEKIGKNIIVMAGSRVDINGFVASADLFVGVSRSALEAMAGAKPVIIAGNEGYIGIFSKKTLDIGMETNFCCRGCSEVTNDILENDIKKVMNISGKEAKELGEYGRNIIIEHYSTEKMAVDAINLYEQVRYSKRKPIDVMISGYYGFDNNGDDVVLKSIIENFKAYNQDINIMVLSKKPKKTQEIYNVLSINRFNFLNIYSKLGSTTILINGGGSLIQDLTSTNSIIYYLTILKMAIMRNVKVMIYANGIGPISRDVNKRRVEKVLNQVDIITLRDEKSLETLKSLGVTKPKTDVTVDAAFGLNSIKNNNDYNNDFKHKLNIEDNEKYFAVAIRSWKHLNDDFEKELAIFCDYMKNEYNLKAVFIPMQPTNDTNISRKVMELMTHQSSFLGEEYSMESLLRVIEKSQFVLGMRLHTLIYAISSQIPVIAISYDPKVSAFMEKAKEKHYIDIKDINSASLIEMAKNVMENRELIIENIMINTKDFKDKAKKNVLYACDLLNEKEF